MSLWVLGCPDCQKYFTHSEIPTNGHSQLTDPFVPWLEPKPQFPEGGLTLVCPNCQKTATYERHELVFQAS
jgi:hypothetical protein